MDDRTNIVVFMGVSIRLRRATIRDDMEGGFSHTNWQNYYILYRAAGDEILAWVHEDSLFDKYGNRFEH